jgi:surfeit locus 1 family protein
MRMSAIDSTTLQMHRPVQLQGRWLPQHSVYLDNRQMNGKPGFYVMTPLALDGSDTVVVVQRGWVQRNFVDRERLPPVETPAGVVQVSGAHRGVAAAAL